MKHQILLSLILLTFLNSNSQQLTSSSLYEIQAIIHNPSIAGVQEGSIIGATYRNQWSGIDGNPVTTNVFGSFSLPNYNVGLGGYVYSDKTGPTSRTGLNLQMAKHIKMKQGTLSLGLEARMQQYKIDVNKLIETLGNDPLLANGNSKFKFDAGFGISFTNTKFQLGAAVSQLVQSKLDFYSGNLGRSAEGRLYRHYYLHGAYFWQVDDENRIVPHGLFICLPNAPLEFQGGVRVEKKDMLWCGILYEYNWWKMETKCIAYDTNKQKSI